MAKLKDRVALLLTGAIAAVFAWAFWSYSGEAGGFLLLEGTLVLLFVENYRLRQQLTKLGHPPKWKR